jgi:hypothetical protein
VAKGKWQLLGGRISISTPLALAFGTDSARRSCAPADLFRLHCGIMRMADILRGGINRNTLYAMRDAGLVVQLARGLYRLAEMAPLSQADLVTVAAKATQAVIYLVSALSFHELTTQIPHEVWIAIARNSEPPRLDYPPIRISRLTDVELKNTRSMAKRYPCTLARRLSQIALAGAMKWGSMSRSKRSNPIWSRIK